MRKEFNDLAKLNGTPLEQSWVQERLETLSEWESIVLIAVTSCRPPATALDAANCLLSLEDGVVFIAPSGYEGLGEHQLRAMAKDVPEELREHIDLFKLGTQFEDKRPGLFVGDYYVAYPPNGKSPVYSDQLHFQPDSGWGVKMKLASPAAPDGVWLRLPDYPELNGSDGEVGEITAAMKALRVHSLDDCTLLEVRCVLPEIHGIMEQYSSIPELVRDGDNLGYVLDEQGQGEARWMEKFSAALEYENCHDLRFALDISQNLHCYEWVSRDSLKEFAANHLRSRGVSEELIRSGCVDLKGYAEDLLETSGYMLTDAEDAYVIRNEQQFIREYGSEEPAGPIEAPPSELERREESAVPQDILTATPFLAAISRHASPEEADAARRALSDSLAGRGLEGLRQLQAAMEYEDCAILSEAVEIAARLDCYEFLEVSSFQEQAKLELLEKGLDERVIDLCFDFEAYAAIVHDCEDIYSSRGTGLYVHRNDAMSQPEQGGMAMKQEMM